MDAENGFLDPEANLGTIRDLLANKPADVMTVEKTAKVSDVIELMKRAGISQVPVIERGHPRRYRQ